VSKFHVDQIATYVTNRYATEHRRPDLDEVNNLSRFLALYSIDLDLGDAPGAAQRQVEITDGGKDRGIDAIAVDPVSNVLVLTQSKWRQDGQGSLHVDEMLRFVEGVRSLVGARNSAEPVHASPELRTAIRDLLVTPTAKIHLVTVTTGSSSLAPEVMEPMVSLLAEMNDLEGVDPVMTHKHLGQAELFTSLADRPRQSVDFDVDLLNWGGGTADPLRIFYGKVSGADVAGWFQQHADALFAENIRVVIPRSEINAGILETVRTAPERFGYYNNGITILAGSINISPGGMLNRDVIRLGLAGASIVNGAQTVSTLGSVLGTEWEQNLGQVFVMTRCIEVPADDPTLARGITRYANTQNEVTSQDFAFLDSEQHRLARELSILGYEYVIRQAEQPTADDLTKIIYIRDAAVALACAATDLGLAVTAKREVSRLFAQSGSEYKRIFNASTDPLVLLRSVLVVRKVDSLLDEIASATSGGVDFGVAVHGRLIIAHLALKKAGSDNLKDPNWDMTATLDDLDSYVPEVTGKLARAFPENSYPGNVFKNRSRCDLLVRDAGLA
jgi:hypothetical protein